LSYIMNLGAWNGVFAVPCGLVDRQLRLAGEAQLKVLLYMLRHSGKSVELPELAKACGITEGDTADALEYWQQQGLIVCKGDQLVPPESAPQSQSEPMVCEPQEQQDAVSASAALQVSSPEITAEAALSAQPAEADDSKPKPKARERIRYSYDECTQMMREDCELRQMLSVLGSILSKNLNHSEIAAFITLTKWYGLPPSCVAMLVEYCREIGKPSLAYIESTGIGWVSEDIITIEQVDSKIKHLRSARTAWNRIRVLLDLPERAPTKKEQEYANVWVNDWSFSDELIQLAYERCVDSKGKLAMSYMNGILSNWHKKGITTAEQAQADVAAVPEKVPRKPEAGSGLIGGTYDRDDIEAMLDDDWMDDA